MGVPEIIIFISQPKTYGVDTQKNRTVLLSTQNICLDCWVRKYLQFYVGNVCLTGRILHVACIKIELSHFTSRVKYMHV